MGEAQKKGGQAGHGVIAFPIISDADRSDSAALTPSPDAEGRMRLRDPGIGIGADGDPMFTLQATKPHSIAWSIMPQNSGKDYKAREVDVLQPLMAGAGQYGNQGGDIIQSAMQVRRLTPVECARLQGFPDDYLDITYRGKPAADGNKYKALGNSWAIPCVRWIGERIEAVESIAALRVAA